MINPKYGKRRFAMDFKNLPPLIFPSSNRTERALITKLKKEGRIHAVGPRLYSSLPKEEWASAVRGNWATLVSTLFPGVLLSHRTALEITPSSEGVVFITSGTSRTLNYPGLTLKFIKGPKALEDDSNFMNIRYSSLARALLENLSTVHKNEKRQRNLPRKNIEKKLEEILHLKGEKELCKIRDRARQIAEQLNWAKEFKKLNALISAMLGMGESNKLVTKSAKARSIGKPYDTSALERFEILFAALKTQIWSEEKSAFNSSEHFKNKAFFEAYFSNYIEGTTFELEEAEEIIFDRKVYEQRPKDSHDVLGTFQIVSDPNEICLTPITFKAFENLMKKRHLKLMGARPEVQPGNYKNKSNSNRAGNTHFVHPDYLLGTLEQGFKFYLELPEGLARAIYIMFLIAEIHPFADGNGRLARVFMNAELTKKSMSRIIIPNVFREDYVGALRAMSRRGRTAPMIKMIRKAFKFSDLNFENYQKVLEHIKAHRWFEEPADSKIIL